MNRAPVKSLVLALSLCCMALAQAGGGPLGIDRRIGLDQSGILARHDQLLLQDLTLAAIVGGALWEGGESRLGRTYWQSLDASVLAAVSATVAKEVFTRARPGQTDDPNKWFQGKGHYSFPSGEVSFISAAVTPFVLEYRSDHPGVYALELLPLYDAVARMKSQAHWQTDVLAGFALGTAAGYYAHERKSPFFLEVLPRGFEAGLKKRW
ncbi:MAG: phosphatase PAP2 family protein [Burkholderiales bacterium]